MATLSEVSLGPFSFSVDFLSPFLVFFLFWVVDFFFWRAKERGGGGEEKDWVLILSLKGSIKSRLSIGPSQALH